MGPNIWGPHGWKFLHFVTMAYPNNPTPTDVHNYRTFFSSLANVIPCGLCAHNYQEHLKMYPLTDNVLKNNQNLTEWCIIMHNLVNAENKKEIYTIDKAVNEIKNNYFIDSEKCRTNQEIKKIIEERIKSIDSTKLIQEEVINYNDINEKNQLPKRIISILILIFTIILIIQILKLYNKK